MNVANLTQNYVENGKLSEPVTLNCQASDYE